MAVFFMPAWRLKPPTLTDRHPLIDWGYGSSIAFPATRTRWPVFGPVAIRPVILKLGRVKPVAFRRESATYAYGRTSWQ